MLAQREYISVKSRTGHFNFCKPQEVSVSTNIAICAPTGEVNQYINISSENEITDTAPQSLIDQIEAEFKRFSFDTGRDKKVEFRDYLKDHEEDLYLGNLQHELSLIEIQSKKLSERMKTIKETLAGSGYFKNGVWIE